MSDKVKSFISMAVPVIGLVVQLYWIYLQIKHWQEPNVDYMALLINVVVTVVLWVILGYLVWSNWSVHRSRHRIQQGILSELWASWSALADSYERLDYDNRNNNSTRFPFNNSSWPEFGQPWSFVNAELYRLAFLARHLNTDTNEVIQILELKGHPPIPRMENGTVMNDFIRECREFQDWLNPRR